MNLEEFVSLTGLSREVAKIYLEVFNGGLMLMQRRVVATSKQLWHSFSMNRNLLQEQEHHQRKQKKGTADPSALGLKCIVLFKRMRLFVLRWPLAFPDCLILWALPQHTLHASYHVRMLQSSLIIAWLEKKIAAEKELHAGFSSVYIDLTFSPGIPQFTLPRSLSSTRSFREVSLFCIYTHP